MRIVILLALMFALSVNVLCPSVRYVPAVKGCIIMIHSNGHVDFACPNNVVICSE